MAPSAPARKLSGVKRKAASDLPDRSATHKKAINMVSDGAGDDAGNGRTPTPLPTEPASNDYEDLRAMADTDNQVCPP